MTAKHSIQLPLLQDNVGVPIFVTLGEITPVEYLDCQEPDDSLIAAIADHWVPPILVCPDNRIDGKHYYPIDGKRRMKAVAYLASIGYEFRGVPATEVPIQAILREDLTPESEASYRIAFQANNLRSPNPLTDVNAVKTTAENLDVDVFTKEGRSAVARQLRTTPQVVGKLAKGLLVDEVIFEAFRQGQIAEQTLTAILNMRDLEARHEIAKRLTAGEKLTSQDIGRYGRETRRETLRQADLPSVAQVENDNPLVNAIGLLETSLQEKKIARENIEQALALLKSLI